MRIRTLFMLASIPAILVAAGTVNSQKLDCNVDVDDRERRLVLLNKALSADDPACVRRILDTGVDPNGLIADRPGTAPILIASEFGNVEILEALFKAGVHRGEPPTLDAFFALIYRKNLDAVKVFLKVGVPVNLKGKSGETPLMAAASLGGQEIATYLLEKGADPNAKTANGVTVLMSASVGVGDDPELLKLLLKAGAGIDSMNAGGENAAFFAVRSGNLRKLEYLLQKGIDSKLKDAKGKTIDDVARQIEDPLKKAKALEIIASFR